MTWPTKRVSEGQFAEALAVAEAIERALLYTPVPEPYALVLDLRDSRARCVELEARLAAAMERLGEAINAQLVTDSRSHADLEAGRAPAPSDYDRFKGKSDLHGALLDAEERVLAAHEALAGLLKEPHGCAFCDSGVLRKRVDGKPALHAGDCPYHVAAALLASNPEGK